MSGNRQYLQTFGDRTPEPTVRWLRPCCDHSACRRGGAVSGRALALPPGRFVV